MAPPGRAGFYRVSICVEGRLRRRWSATIGFIQPLEVATHGDWVTHSGTASRVVLPTGVQLVAPHGTFGLGELREAVKLQDAGVLQECPLTDLARARAPFCLD